MSVVNYGILMDLSSQLKSSVFNYKNTYTYSFRFPGHNAIRLNSIEYELCLNFVDQREKTVVFSKLSSKYTILRLEESYQKLVNQGIICEKKRKDFKRARIISFSDEISNRPFPRAIVWNITEKCNLKCHHCINKNFICSNSPKFLKEQDYDNTIRTLIMEMDENGLERLQLSGGEPLLSPLLYYILGHAHKADFCVDIFTNGTVFNKKSFLFFEEYLKYAQEKITFHISLDGDMVSHNKLRNSDDAYQKTIKSIKTLKKYHATINVETIVSNANYQNMEKHIINLINLGVNSVFLHPALYSDKNNDINNGIMSDK